MTREFTAEERRCIQDVLANGLGPEFISYRSHAGANLAYVEGYKAISTLQMAACCVSPAIYLFLNWGISCRPGLANNTFGFDGWNSSVKQLTTDFCEVNAQGKYSVGVTAIVRIELKNGAFHEVGLFGSYASGSVASG